MKPKKPKTEVSRALVQLVDPQKPLATATEAVELLPAVDVPKLIRRPAEQEVVIDMLRQVATAEKLVTSEEKKVTSLLDQAKRSIRALFKPLHERLQGWREDLDSRLLEYDDWQWKEQEKERAKLKKKADAKRRRMEAAARKKLEAARSRAERAEIQAKSSARMVIEEANLDRQLAEVPNQPDPTPGVALIEDYDVVIVDPEAVPETYDNLVLWTRQFNRTNLKKLAKRDIAVPGVRFEPATRTAVRSL